MQINKIVLSIAIIATSFASFAQVGVGTTNVDPSAVFQVESTTKGFIPPRMTKVQMDAIATPAEGVIVYCTNCSPKGMYVNNGITFVSMVNPNIPSVPAGVALAAGEVYSVTGKIWQDKNLGATRVARSSTDYESYGHLYQWGRKSDGHQVIVRTQSIVADGSDPAAGSSSAAPGPVVAGTEGANFIFINADWLTVPDNTRWQTVGGANNPCASGYRVPTETELNNERMAFTSNDAAGAFASTLKIPVAGRRDSTTGKLFGIGKSGGIWTSTVSSSGSVRLAYSNENDDADLFPNGQRANGYSIRCIKD